MDRTVYNVWNGSGMRFIAQTDDPKTAAFYANVGYTVRIAS